MLASHACMHLIISWRGMNSHLDGVYYTLQPWDGLMMPLTVDKALSEVIKFTACCSERFEVSGVKFNVTLSSKLVVSRACDGKVCLLLAQVS